MKSSFAGLSYWKRRCVFMFIRKITQPSQHTAMDEITKSVKKKSSLYEAEYQWQWIFFQFP